MTLPGDLPKNTNQAEDMSKRHLAIQRVYPIVKNYLIQLFPLMRNGKMGTEAENDS